MAHLSRRQKIAASATALVLVGSGTAAFAFWSSTGAGSGAGSTTTGGSNLTISGDVASQLYPGQGAQPFTVTVKNNADNNARVAGLTAVVTTDKVGCDGSDFSINGSSSSASPVTLNFTAIDLAKDVSSTSSNTIQFINKTSNQDACKDAHLVLTYASN
ncbi:hypothetical protein [Phycicoccus sp. Root101]|uniref:hypothetical protein n=1 Tax=Phycicoccus sp. Root101 TaxID=1736421 RepID=UPI00070375FF|nr:hypothetical protein [Phycicoccus sp. Root101]KQU65427.1 hypothetical protein ASC58_18310 [Phycicoccus sp. Root101]